MHLDDWDRNVLFFICVVTANEGVTQWIEEAWTTILRVTIFMSKSLLVQRQLRSLGKLQSPARAMF